MLRKMSEKKKNMIKSVKTYNGKLVCKLKSIARTYLTRQTLNESLGFPSFLCF